VAENLIDAESNEAEAKRQIVAEVANQLVVNRIEFTQLVANMLASRHLYAVCMYELELLLSKKLSDYPELKDFSEDQLTFLKEILISAAAMQAQQPFDEGFLFHNMTQSVFPWLEKVCVEHSTHQAEENQKITDAAEAARRQKLVRFSLPGVPALPRKNSVVFVGEPFLLSWLVEHLLESWIIDPDVSQIVDLHCSLQPKTENEFNSVETFDAGDKRLVIPENIWENCVNTSNGFKRVYSEYTDARQLNPVDILLVRNLLHAYEAQSAYSLPFRANEAQRRFKKWGDESGAIVVGLLPVSRKLQRNELNGPEYEQLRLHNLLRSVESKDLPDSNSCEIWVGNERVCTVDNSQLKAHKKSCDTTKESE